MYEDFNISIGKVKFIDNKAFDSNCNNQFFILIKTDNHSIYLCIFAKVYKEIIKSIKLVLSPNLIISNFCAQNLQITDYLNRKRLVYCHISHYKKLINLLGDSTEHSKNITNNYI